MYKKYNSIRYQLMCYDRLDLGSAIIICLVSYERVPHTSIYIIGTGVYKEEKE